MDAEEPESDVDTAAARREGGVPGGVRAETLEVQHGWTMDGPLVTVADVMTPTSVLVGVHETVATAAELLRRHTLAGLPVVDGGRIVGLVTPLALLREPVYRIVADVMTAGITPATPDLTVLQAHALFAGQRVDVLPVVEGDGVVGQLTLVAILRAFGQQTDPLTGLPWASALRAWASAALAHGQEIGVLFIDLDNFGVVNKALGHVVGDDILRSIASLLGGLVDASTDLLCRYGGDEFAIATTRRDDDARALAQRIEETINLPVEIGEAGGRVTVTVGIAGGRRVEGRAPSHIAATVEDLLTLASRASTAAKETAEGGVRRGGRDDAGGLEAGTGEARLRLSEVMVYAEPGGCSAAVTLRLDTREGVGRATGPVHGRGIMYLVAAATLAAVRQTIGEHHTYILEELTEVPSDTGKLIVAVLSNGAEPQRRLIGGASAPDLSQAVSKAILDALNRRLARTLADYLRHDTSP